MGDKITYSKQKVLYKCKAMTILVGSVWWCMLLNSEFEARVVYTVSPRIAKDGETLSQNTAILYSQA